MNAEAPKYFLCDVIGQLLLMHVEPEEMSVPEELSLYFAGSFGTEDVRLWEVESEAMLGQLAAGTLSIKGLPSDEAVLCSPDTTYSIRLAESTNTLLLSSPSRPDQVEMHPFLVSGPSSSHLLSSPPFPDCRLCPQRL